MGKNVLLKKSLVVGIVLLCVCGAIPSVFGMCVSAEIPHARTVNNKALIANALFPRGEWTEQATGFVDPNRGIGYISSVNESVVWAAAFNGDNPSYPCQDFTRTVNGGTTWTTGTIPNSENQFFSMIFALDANRAWAPMCAPQNGVMGLYYTSDGGTSWVRQESADFNYIGSFPNCVHFWDADVGWCMGDPADGYFEIYTTTDGGTTWTRVPAADIPAPLQGEYGLIGSCCAVGDTVWFGTTMGRVYKSSDRGLHWTVAQTTLRSYTKPAFRDVNHGLVLAIDTAGTTVLSETSDGDVTWQNVAYTGPCYSYDLCYVPGTVDMYISVGASPNASGASFSRDGGNTWTDYAEMTGIPLLCLGFTAGQVGWAGSYNTDAVTGGIFKHVPGISLPAFSIDVTGGKGFTVNVTNVGDEAATDITVNVTVMGGLFITPKEFTDIHTSLQMGGSADVDCPVRGIGLGILTMLPTITVDVICGEGVTATRTVEAKIFFSKVILQ